MLSEREAQIVRSRALSLEGKTLDAIGKQMGISKERVRQIETQAMQKLRRALIRIVGNPEKMGLLPDN